MESTDREIRGIFRIMISEMIANLEAQRENFGLSTELRGIYNEVLDRLRVLGSKLFEIQKPDHLRRR